MANRETFPASLFPLRGDLSAEAGATAVTVIGIQGIPVISTPPTDKQVLTYVAADGEWEPQPGSGAGNEVQINGQGASGDYVIFINRPGLHGQVLINGA